jgi:hypothetical protein
MFCPKCGASNDDNAWRCVQCNAELHSGAILSKAGRSAGGGVPPLPFEEVKDYLVQSILVTIFCCLPFGIAAIVYAVETRTKRDLGDIEGALLASKKARMWCWWSFGSIFVIGILWILVIAVGIISSNSVTF